MPREILCRWTILAYPQREDCSREPNGVQTQWAWTSTSTRRVPTTTNWRLNCPAESRCQTNRCLTRCWWENPSVGRHSVTTWQAWQPFSALYFSQNGENELFPRFDQHFSRFGSSLSKKNRNFAASKQQINIYKQFKTLQLWKKKRKQLSKSSSSKRLTVAKVQ